MKIGIWKWLFGSLAMKGTWAADLAFYTLISMNLSEIIYIQMRLLAVAAGECSLAEAVSVEHAQAALHKNCLNLDSTAIILGQKRLKVAIKVAIKELSLKRLDSILHSYWKLTVLEVMDHKQPQPAWEEKARSQLKAEMKAPLLLCKQ